MPWLTSMKINKPLPKIIDSFCMAIGTWSHDHMTHPFIDQASLSWDMGVGGLLVVHCLVFWGHESIGVGSSSCFGSREWQLMGQDSWINIDRGPIKVDWAWKGSRVLPNEGAYPSSRKATYLSWNTGGPVRNGMSQGMISH